MINVLDLRYVRLGTPDVNRAIKYCTDIVGLELVRRINGSAYLRGDDRDHNVCYFQGDPADTTFGLELDREWDLDAAVQQLEGDGVKVRRGTEKECADRRVMAFANFKDPTGNSVN